MKPNTRLRLEQGFLIVIILIVVGLVVRGHKQTENLASVTHWAQEKTVIEYIKSKDDLKPVKFVLAQQIVDISGVTNLILKKLCYWLMTTRKKKLFKS